MGRGFANFLKRHNSEFYNTAAYRHTFPDGREVDANMSHRCFTVFIRYINEGMDT